MDAQAASSFLNLDETLPYDEDELQELNMFASGPEEGYRLYSILSQ